jgi:hypothetical protein
LIFLIFDSSSKFSSPKLFAKLSTRREHNKKHNRKIEIQKETKIKKNNFLPFKALF